MSNRSDVKTRPDDICEETLINPDKVAAVIRNMSDEEDLLECAELFKALGDSTRIRILHALSLDELCVCDLAATLGMTQSAISHQLRILRMARLVKYRKSGKMAYYSLDDDHVRMLLIQGISHAKETQQH